jgi:[ribosomal protein S5]-alanine N-acetyltransferase
MTPFNFTPFPNLSTERLTLRQMKREDENEIFNLRSDERVLQFIDIPKAVTVEDARKFIEKINKSIPENESIMWAITLKDDDKLIGTICFWNIATGAMKAEIGYMLHPEFQGKGIMQEAVIKVIDYGFKTMRLNTIVADLDPKNSPSLKILEKNGFVYTGKEDDLVIFSLPVANWQSTIDKAIGN